MTYLLTFRENVDAAHFLRGYQGKCSNLHGHTWNIEVTVSGKELNELGILVDFKDIKTVIQGRTGTRFDHKCWNEHKPFDKINPTAENIARYVFEDIKSCGLLPAGVKVEKVRVYESERACATYKEN